MGILKENVHVDRALTLHHLKLSYIMYKVHRHYNMLQLAESDQVCRIKVQA